MKYKQNRNRLREETDGCRMGGELWGLDGKGEGIK